ncbi:alpha/beta hydrolase [Nocardioides sp.]|uniref:alpha/beta hydrolase n=1 Tax=Nocardioides sp. TaxID=35761 RepID=UPI003D0AF520
MPLHPVAQQLLEDAASSDQPNSHLLPVAVARANFENLFGSLPVEDIASFEDLNAATADGQVPVRLYKPNTAGAATPLIYFIHGGGWQMGSLDSHDGICRAIANATGYAVLSVGYRRPPEHKFPAAPHDCYHALAWAVANAATLGIDPERVAIVGDSAGGNLAASVALQARDKGGPGIACQALIYPATTFDLDRGFNAEFEGYVLFRDEVQWHKDAYFTHAEEAESDYASPLNADLAGLPPTLVLTAEYDPIGIAGVALADRLVTAGVRTDHRQYEGMIHGFIQFPGLFNDATAAVADIADHLRAYLDEGVS